MTARLGRVVACLALPLAGLGFSGGPAAADDYPSSIVTETEVDVVACVRVGIPIEASATVTTDVPNASRGTAVAAPASPADGSVELSIDGEVFSTQAVGDGTVEATIPKRLARLGEHTVGARYVPGPDSAYMASSDTAPLRIVDGGDGCATPDGGEISGGGVLPNTGGIWGGFVLLGLLALGGGSYLVHRSRQQQARRRRRNRPFVPADLPDGLSV